MSNLIGSTYVPDEGPEDASILMLGEAPGEIEEFEKRPFVGESGKLLRSTIGRADTGYKIRFANRCHYRPQGNKFEHLIDSPQLAEGDRQLEEYITTHRPNVVVALGAKALEFLTGKKGIFAWRGSVLSSNRDTINPPIKVIPTFHPAAVLRDRTLLPIFDGDIRRALLDSTTPDLNLPQRTYIVDPRGIELENITEELCESDFVSVDIESVKKSTHILCVGFANNPNKGVCIVNREDAQTQNSIQRILASPVKKIFHFGTFDTEMLHLNGHETQNYYWDTLVAQHVLNAELPRGLDFLTSIYTREPYYKASGRSEIPGDQKSWGTKVDKQKLWIYNCKDVCVTIEIALQQMQELVDEDDIDTFKYEMELIEVGQTIGRTGMLCDMERRQLFETALYWRWAKLQNIMELLCGKDVNVRSPKLKELLYGDFKLPVRRNRKGGVTTDEDAIVSLITYTTDYYNGLKQEAARADWKRKLLILKAILEIRGLRVLLSNYVKAKISGDNRYRSTYKYSSTETGRGAAERYVDGTGVNSQTFSRGYVEIVDEALNMDEHVAKKLAAVKEVNLEDEDEESEEEEQENVV